MATLDIRTSIVSNYDSIRFSDNANGAMEIVLFKDRDFKDVLLLDENKDPNPFVAINDIDNLILALQKAKELWS
jgi:hypothetical protein